MALTVAEIDVIYRARMADLERGEAKVRRSVTQTREIAQRESSQTAKAVEDMQRRIDKAVKGISFAAAAATVYKLTTAWSAFHNVLAQVEPDAEKVASQMGALYEAAQRAKVPLELVGGIYSSLNTATADLGISQERLVRITETIAKAAPNASGALIQLGQALGTGQLRGDEFNSMMEGAPALMRGIASSMGQPVAALREMAAQGQLTTAVVLKGLEDFAAEADRIAARTITTPAQALTVLGNALTKSVGEMDQALGVTEKMAGAILALIENLHVLGDAFLVIAAAIAGRAVFALGATAVSALSAARGVTMLQAALAVAQGQAVVTAAAMRGLSAALAFFGGPWGLAITAMAGGMAYLALQTDDATAAFDRLRSATDGVMRAYNDVLRINEEIARDKAALQRASEAYANASKTEGQAVLDVAALEIDAIRQRIAAREKLRQAMADEAVLQAEAARRARADAESNIQDRARAELARGAVEGLQGPAALRSRGGASAAQRLQSIEEMEPAALMSAWDDLAKEARAALQSGKEISDDQHEFYTEIVKTNSAYLRELDGFEQAMRAADLLSKPIEQVAELRRPEIPGGSGGITPSVASTAASPLDKLRRDAALAADEVERLTAIYDRFSNGASPPALSEIETAQKVAESERRIAEAKARAPEGGAAEAEILERRKMRIEELRDLLRGLAGAEAEAARTSEETAEKRKAASDALSAASREVARAMADQIRLQAALARGGQEAYEQEARAISARNEARDLARRAEEAGIAVNVAALEREILAREDAASATEKLRGRLEAEAQTRERLAALQERSAAALSRAALEFDAAEAGSLAQLEAMVKARDEALKALERQGASDVAAKDMGDSATPEQIRLAREAAEAEFDAEEARRKGNESIQERRAALQAEEELRKRLADLETRSARAAGASGRASGAAGAIASAESVEALDKLLKGLAEAEKASERRAAIEDATAGKLGEEAAAIRRALEEEYALADAREGQAESIAARRKELEEEARILEAMAELERGRVRAQARAGVSAFAPEDLQGVQSLEQLEQIRAAREVALKQLEREFELKDKIASLPAGADAMKAQTDIEATWAAIDAQEAMNEAMDARGQQLEEQEARSQKLSQDFLKLASSAKSFEGALKGVLARLLEIGAQNLASGKGLFGGGGGLFGMGGANSGPMISFAGGGGGGGGFLGTALGFLGSLFDGGGYTGAGGRKEPAGVVHKGEVVFSQDDVARWGGPAAVDAMRRRSPFSYDLGGIGGLAPLSLPAAAPMPFASRSVSYATSAPITINGATDPEATARAVRRELDQRDAKLRGEIMRDTLHETGRRASRDHRWLGAS